MDDSLEVDPTELWLTAVRIDVHASDFEKAHQQVYSDASQSVLGSGLAGEALRAMLEAWETDRTRFGNHFVRHAEGHRAAAKNYERTDVESASGLSAASDGL